MNRRINYIESHNCLYGLENESVNFMMEQITHTRTQKDRWFN